ncbi:MAG TPA: hypothetical protein VEZ46_02260 [Mycobacteriales bacterium]|jgi:hypothetical protein|nr:hypothetical protein [Mycobacteriales bacterium]
MATLTCVDASTLDVQPVMVVDRDAVPYELTLRMTRDGAPFGAVGERCGFFLAATAGRLRAAADETIDRQPRWADEDDRFPASSAEGGVRAWAADSGLDADQTWAALQRYLPRERDLFAFRTRDPDDLATIGELRCSVRTQRTWEAGEGVAGGGGQWRLARRAVVEAWGDEGAGVRAVVGAVDLRRWVTALLDEAAAMGCSYDAVEPSGLLRRPAG